MSTDGAPIKFDAALYPSGPGYANARLSDVAACARGVEEAGFDGGYVLDGVVDPILSLTVAAEATNHLELVTGVAIAFARSPMTTALQAWNLQELSGGRLVLGLGSQVRAHIEKRFSMPWGSPAARMREYVLALRAIWDTWGRGVPLGFRGTYYTHTLMTPTFSPGPIEAADPAVLIGALGPRMLAVAGEVADGLYGHPFVTVDYLRDVQIPALERGLEARADSLDSRFVLSAMPMVITGRTADERAAAEVAVRRQCAFYGSTPAYYPVLEHHGYAGLGPQLNTMSKLGEWDAMAESIDDDLLALLTVQGTPEEIPGRLLDRVGDTVDRVQLYAPYESDSAMWSGILHGLHRAQQARIRG